MARYHKLDSINIIWIKTTFGLAVALGLFLWGWIKPEWHFMFLTQSVPFPIRMFLWGMSFVLCANVGIYACGSFAEWFERV